VSIAEAYDIPASARHWCAKPAARAANLTALGRLRRCAKAQSELGQRAYEEDIVQGRFFGHGSFILNTPDAIRHVLVDNYENYTRTPPASGVAPMLGEAC